MDNEQYHYSSMYFMFPQLSNYYGADFEIQIKKIVSMIIEVPSLAKDIDNDFRRYLTRWE